MMAAVEAEVERRVTEKRLEMDAELAREMLVISGKRLELDRLLDKLTDKLTERMSDTSLEVSDSDSVTSTIRGTPSYQLDFIFNKLRPRTQGVMWPTLRAAFNAEPERFEIGEGHVSSGDPIPHYTIYYKCPVLKSDKTMGTYIIKIHVRYTEVAGQRPKFTSVWALTQAGSPVPQEIANFC